MNQSSSSQGSGCGRPLGIGCLIVVVGLLLLGFGGYYGVMHTSLPLKWFAGAIEDSETHVEISGVSGSIKSGIGIERLAFEDENGNENLLEGLDIGWDLDHSVSLTTVTLEKLEVERAHFFIDRSAWTGSDETEDSSSDEESDASDDANGEPAALIIRNVNIRNVTLEDPETGVLFELESIQLDHFKQSDDPNIPLEMGKLIVASNLVSATVTPRDGEIGSDLDLEGRIDPQAHPSLIRAIAWSGRYQAANEGKIDLDIFVGAVTVTGDETGSEIAFTDFTPTDFLTSAIPLKAITGAITIRDSDEGTPKSIEVAQLSFRIGEHSFAVTPVTLAEADLESGVAILEATSNEVRCRLHLSESLETRIEFPGRDPFEVISQLLEIDTASQAALKASWEPHLVK